MLWGMVLVPLIAWGNLRGAALIGLQRVAFGQLPDNFLRPGILLVLLLGSYFWRSDFVMSAADAMILTVIAGLLSLFIITLILHANRPVRSIGVRPTYRHRARFVAIWPLALVAGMQVINRHIDILILGLFVSAEQVGIYRVVAQSAELVAFVLVIVNTVIAPHVARLQASGGVERLRWVVTRGAQMSLLGALPIALVMLLAGDIVLLLVFGSGYHVGYTALAILSVGQLFNTAMGSVGLILNMTGHERKPPRELQLPYWSTCL
ncbi:MAG: oligosaccharide flippase family protein [Gammaproteobacteria bacterium]|nr:oligosaccharide flippase family protein [Gammaproteobacteria bacterium]